MMTIDLRVKLRSCKEQGLRGMVLSSSVVINRSFHQVFYHYSFPFLYFTLLFIAWETLSHHVT